MPIKRLILMFIICIITVSAFEKGDGISTDTLYIANWNVENLFDISDDPATNDEEFTPGSEKQWDEMKFQRKIMNLARVIKYMNEGKAPDIIALEEVENILVVKYLAYEFKNRDYIVCHRQSPDERGIDNALLYDRKVFDIVKITAIPIALPSGNPTRDILSVSLKRKGTEKTIHVFVNHWPSRRGGEEESAINRITAAEKLKRSVVALYDSVKNAEVVILGDFNDEPGDTSIYDVLGADSSLTTKSNFVNTAYKKFRQGEGSYMYRKNWNMLDQIILSSSLFDNKNYMYIKDSFEIIKPEFMITKEGDYKGAPIPTFAGKKYLAGYSDHFPVGIKLLLIN